jgi:hypothetical protein
VTRLVIVQRVVAGAIVVYWLAFAIEGAPMSLELEAFELSFPLPDLAWLVPLLVAGAHWTSRGDARGPVASAAAAGALVFLGLVDVAFNVRFDRYVPLVGGGGLNLVINAGCVGAGVWMLVRLAAHAGAGERRHGG